MNKVYPKPLMKAKNEAEEMARKEVEEKAKQEAGEQVENEAEEKAKQEARKGVFSTFSHLFPLFIFFLLGLAFRVRV
jgi:hypothetical protein